MVLATWVTRQLVFDGFISGLAVGLLAMGIVLIYRSTRVINFAVGNMGVVASSTFALLVIEYDWPFWIAFAAALLCGALFAAAVELAVIRRLFDASRVTLLVATVGIAQLAQLVVLQLPEVSGAARYPVFWGSRWKDVANTGIDVRGTQLAIFVGAIAAAVLLGLLLGRTQYGRRVAGAADNPALSRISGFNPKTISTSVWIIAGLLASISMILLSGRVGNVAGVLDLGTSTLSKALVAAALAKLVSFWRAMAAGILVGIGESLLRFNFFDRPGLAEFVMLIAVLAAVYLQGRSEGEPTTFRFSVPARRIPEHLRNVWWLKNLSRIALGAGFALAVVLVYLPGIADRPTRHQLYAQMIALAICGISVTVITGWSGQLSIAQMAIAGLGALFAAALHRGLTIELFGTTYEWVEVPFILTLPITAVAGALLALILGLGSLRVRGLFLGITTFVFALAAERFLYRLDFLATDNPAAIPYRRTEILGVDLGSQRAWYYVCLVALGVCFAIVARLRYSGVGRAAIAVRDNADTASGYTINATRTKLLSFSLAGGLAALGGALVAGATEVVDLTNAGYFLVDDSLNIIGMVVIGGVGSVMGPLLGAIWVYGIPTIFDDSSTVALFSSSVGLLLVLLYFPGGLVQVGHSIRSWLIDVASARHPAGQESESKEAPALPVSHRDKRPLVDPVLNATDISVNFGGIQALASASIQVRPDEIVGLIGTNGAGKSTFLNAVGGYVPSSGSIELFGSEISGFAIEKRAELGLGRTFQAASLFPELTVRETVQVALEARGRTGFFSTALHLPRAAAAERVSRSEAEEILDFLGLGPLADLTIAELSTGTRRVVQIGGLLALDASMLCLDEPTAGMGQREVEVYAPLIGAIQKEIGTAMLIVEHDMPMIMSLSHRVYCLESGQVIAEGSPEDVRRNEAVIRSYLGTDSRAIARRDNQ